MCPPQSAAFHQFRTGVNGSRKRHVDAQPLAQLDHGHDTPNDGTNAGAPIRALFCFNHRTEFESSLFRARDEAPGVSNEGNNRVRAKDDGQAGMAKMLDNKATPQGRSGSAQQEEARSSSAGQVAVRSSSRVTGVVSRMENGPITWQALGRGKHEEQSTDWTERGYLSSGEQ